MGLITAIGLSHVTRSVDCRTLCMCVTTYFCIRGEFYTRMALSEYVNNGQDLMGARMNVCVCVGTCLNVYAFVYVCIFV